MGKINLSNLKKCGQSWDDMSPHEDGRLCSECKHTIIDFREFTDQEIAERHIFTPGKVCGIYTRKQLKNTSKPSKKVFVKPLYFSLISLFFSSNLKSQDVITQPKIEQHAVLFQNNNQQNVNKNNDKINQDSIILTGHLTDKLKKPLIGGSVHVKGTKIWASTDINGFYILNVTEAINNEKFIHVIFSYIGFASLEVVIPKDKLEATKNLEQNATLNKSMVITGFYAKERTPIHKKVWRKTTGWAKKFFHD